jgi:uncharacterized protein YdeI (YjbR/CyaY-like superfamily)
MSRDPRVDAYIAGKAEFARPILAHLREAIHSACPTVEETIKWGMPSFTYKDRILAGMAAFKQHAVFDFWRSEEMSWQSGKAHEAMGQLGKIHSVNDLPSDATLDALIREVVAKFDAGPAPRKPKHPPKPAPDTPDDLRTALDADPKAAATFDGFPPSCRREYVEWVVEAKRPETRAKRIAQAIEWMAEGKRRNWKYEAC